jgi:hypothetical protein
MPGRWEARGGRGRVGRGGGVGRRGPLLGDSIGASNRRCEGGCSRK